MSNYNITPLFSQTLTANEQIRAYVHPTRMTILALLAQEKQSISGVARQIAVHPANLTHHFKLLEKAGLI
jgi:DNA-binding transcriptional ArsR family regulator